MDEEIKTGDIMVGNWVNVLPHNKPSQIIEIKSGRPDYKDYVRISSPDLETKFATEIENIKGIPLTEDILIKAGFGLFNNGVFARKDLERPALLMFSYSVNRKNIYCEIMGWRIECKYLHQLQNLFKSLTGNDLKIGI